MGGAIRTDVELGDAYPGHFLAVRILGIECAGDKSSHVDVALDIDVDEGVVEVDRHLAIGQEVWHGADGGASQVAE